MGLGNETEQLRTQVMQGLHVDIKKDLALKLTWSL